MKNFAQLYEDLKSSFSKGWDSNEKKNKVTFSPDYHSISDTLTQLHGRSIKLQLYIHPVDAPNQLDLEFVGQFEGRADLQFELRALLLNKELFPTLEEPDGTTIIIRLPLQGNHKEQSKQIGEFIEYLSPKLQSYQSNSGAISPASTSLDSSISKMVEAAKKTEKQSGNESVTVQKHKEVRFDTDEDFEDYLAQLHEAQAGLCALSGLQLQPYNKDDQYSMSLDRIDSDGHYEPGNLQLVCRFINLWKSDTDNEQFKQLLDAVRAQVATSEISTKSASN